MADASTSAPDVRHPGLSFRQFVLLVASLMAVNALAIDSMLPALPQIGESLSIAAPNDRQWIITAYLFGFGVSQLVYGPLSDRYGRRPVLIAGLVMFVATSFMAGFAGSFRMMIAARVLQGVAAGATRVLAVSIIRDCYSGRQMARVMSLAMIVFLAAPIIAPSLGQLILLVGPWRWIFNGLGGFGVLVLVWTVLRLPETLHPEDRLPIAVRPIFNAAREVVTNRVSIGYTLAATMLWGGMFGFIASIQQIFTDVFRLPQLFPAVFALAAGTMALASFANARLVERIGSRKISHGALLIYIAIALIHVVIAVCDAETVWTFGVLQALMMGCMGLAGSNFGAMAMQPVGHIAGTASSVQGFLSTIGGALIGSLIGQSYDGTTLPLSLGYLIFSVLGLGIVLVVERGRLFRSSQTAPAPVRAQ